MKRGNTFFPTVRFRQQQESERLLSVAANSINDSRGTSVGNENRPIQPVANGSQLKFYEVVGPPGAGKSTFVQTATSASSDTIFRDLEGALFLGLCRAKGITPNEVTQKWSWRSRGTPLERRNRFVAAEFHLSHLRFDALLDFCSNYSGLMALVFRALPGGTSETHRRDVLNWLFNFYARFHYVNTTTTESLNVLVDEGFVGRAITLFAYAWPSARHADLQAYLHVIPRPHTVIRLNLGSDRCFERLRLRAKGIPKRFKRLSTKEQLMTLRFCQECLDMAVSELIAMGTPVIDVDALLAPQEQVRRVVETVRRSAAQLS